jgi:hypothetical protein
VLEHGQESGQDTENDYGLVFADFSITETQTTALNKIAAPCKFYNDDREKNPAAPGETEFTKCFKEKFRGVLSSQVSISSTFYVRVFFRTKVLCTAFLYGMLALYSLAKGYRQKSALKLLMKLTIGVNFTYKFCCSFLLQASKLQKYKLKKIKFETFLGNPIS